MTTDASGGGSGGEVSSSRVIIKNLPSYLSEKRLKDHISSIGCNITDVKIVRKNSHTNPEVKLSRRFGYVGLYSEEDAKKVLEYFDGTFIDTSRIHVQYAFPPGSSLLPRPWSKYSVGSSQYNKRNNAKSDADGTEMEPVVLSNEDPSKKEDFSRWISQKNSSKSWLDSADLLNSDEINSVDRGARVYSEVVRPTKAGVSSVRKHIQFSESETEPESVSGDETLDQAGGDSSTNVSDSETGSEQCTDSESGREDHDSQEDGVCAEEQMVTSPTETSRLMVVNISYSTTEEDLASFFSRWGEVKSVSIIRSPESGVSKGYGFVQYEFSEHAVSALSQAHLSLLHGRVLRVSPAFNKPTKMITGSMNEPNVVVHSNYKLKALSKRKESSLDKKTWNLLYMSGNSAVNAFIESEDVKKHEVVDVQAPDLASRVSLMETHVISATKEWLKKEGISVKAFEVEGSDIFSAKLKFDGTVESMARSEDTIIIKHLPSDQVALSDLQKLCSPFGRINRLCLSPSRTIAIVQYLDKSSADHAFRRLVFKRFKGIPLYLEWAPVGLFVLDTKKQDEGERDSRKLVGGKEGLGEDGDSDLVGGIHVFVKNLSFNTTKKDLESLFGKLDGFRKATVTMKSHSDSDGNIVKKSMGYGFLEFKTSENARECVKRMQSIALDGHTLELMISRSSKNSQVACKSSLPYVAQSTDVQVKNASNKLLVKNLPFQATKSDVMSLFNSVGTVTSIRIPKKSDGTNKGYCFIEFLGKLEAIAALEQFQHTHLYGRHLIVELAEGEEENSSGKSSPKRKKAKSV